MFLHAGDDVTIDENRIVMILGIKKDKKGSKSIIILDNGKKVLSRINPATLKQRIDRKGLPSGSLL